MPEKHARIIIGASPVGIDQRHAYLLFERSDGSQTVIRGGPDARAEGNDLVNFSESTLFGSDKFGNIVVDKAPYVHPYSYVIQRQANGAERRIPAEQADLNDPTLRRNQQGEVIAIKQNTPDWPLPGERHERLVVWQGTDQDLEAKLNAAWAAGQQINDAKLEYSPLHNNSNGVASTLLKAADIAPSLPLGKDGKEVDAPDFGENLYQDIGLASNRSGYWFDGKQWYDSDDRKIEPPHSGEPTIPLDPGQEKRQGSGSFDSNPDNREHPNHAMLNQIRDGVRRIDQDIGKPYDEASERLSHAALAACRDNREMYPGKDYPLASNALDRADHVVMGGKGNLFVVQGDLHDPTHKRAMVNVEQAINTSVEQSDQKLQAANLAISRELEQARQQELARNMEPPTRSGPAMT